MKIKEAKWGKQKTKRRLQDDSAYISDDFYYIVYRMFMRDVMLSYRSEVLAMSQVGRFGLSYNSLR